MSGFYTNITGTGTDAEFDKEVECCCKIGSIKVVNLRKEARGRECYVKLDGICNGDPETVVLHHVRHTQVTRKADKLAVPVCGACHAAIHRQTNADLDADFVELEELRGMRRWQAQLHREGKL